MGWGSALEEMMKNVVLPPPGGKIEGVEDKVPAEETAAPPAEEPVVVEPVQEVEPIAPAKESVSVNGPAEVTSDSVPNGDESTRTSEPATVTEIKEKLPGDLEEGEIE